MSARFYLSIDKASCCLEIEMGGFFQEDDVARFAESLRLYLAEMACPPNQHTTLCDIQAMEIQSQETVELFKALVGQGRVRSRKLAFITSKTLARKQASRLTSREGVSFFDSVDDARRWLRC